jgi:hypothetical protein
VAGFYVVQTESVIPLLCSAAAMRRIRSRDDGFQYESESKNHSSSSASDVGPNFSSCVAIKISFGLSVGLYVFIGSPLYTFHPEP